MSKRAPSSKAKGAVRAKSGCYTCRIRRKKCDEKPDAEGQCQTCVRLRLQCLGFGAKRPDWMREGNSVSELRLKIKGFLAQNGMIKGHSAAAAAAAAEAAQIGPAGAAGSHASPSRLGSALSPLSPHDALSVAGSSSSSSSDSPTLSAHSPALRGDPFPPNAHSPGSGFPASPHARPASSASTLSGVSPRHRARSDAVLVLNEQSRHASAGTAGATRALQAPTLVLPGRAPSRDSAGYPSPGGGTGYNGSYGLGLEPGPLNLEHDSRVQVHAHIHGAYAGHGTLHPPTHSRRSFLPSCSLPRIVDSLGNARSHTIHNPLMFTPGNVNHHPHALSSISHVSMLASTLPPHASVTSGSVTGSGSSSFAHSHGMTHQYAHHTFETPHVDSAYPISPLADPFSPRRDLGVLGGADAGPASTFVVGHGHNHSTNGTYFGSAPANASATTDSASVRDPPRIAGLDIDYEHDYNFDPLRSNNSSLRLWDADNVEPKREPDPDADRAALSSLSMSTAGTIVHGGVAPQNMHNGGMFTHAHSGAAGGSPPGMAPTLSPDSPYPRRHNGDVMLGYGNVHGGYSVAPMAMTANAGAAGNAAGNSWAPNADAEGSTAPSGRGADAAPGPVPSGAVPLHAQSQSQSTHVHVSPPQQPHQHQHHGHHHPQHHAHQTHQTPYGVHSHDQTQSHAQPSGAHLDGRHGHGHEHPHASVHGPGHPNGHTHPQSQSHPLSHADVRAEGDAGLGGGGRSELAVGGGAGAGALGALDASRTELGSLGGHVGGAGAGGTGHAPSVPVPAPPPYPQIFQQNYSNASLPLVDRDDYQENGINGAERPPPSQESRFSQWYHGAEHLLSLELEADPELVQTTYAQFAYPQQQQTAIDYAMDGQSQALVFCVNANGYGTAQPPPPMQIQMPAYTLIDPFVRDRADGRLIDHYIRFVRPVQYFFLDASVFDTQLLKLADRYDATRDALCFVASVHRNRASRAGNTIGLGRGSQSPDGRGALPAPPSPPVADTLDEDSARYYELAQVKLRRGRANRRLTPGEAMAGLQCVSSYLFAGGGGSWDWFLDFACEWLKVELENGSANGGSEGRALAELARRDELTGTIARMTMWFEVLASVTHVREPRFLNVYKEVFGGAHMGVVDANGEVRPVESCELEMLDVMGCDNQTFLAIAKTSALAAWKENERTAGKLSIKELVERGMEIEKNYLKSTDIEDAMDIDSNSAARLPEDSLLTRKKLTAGVFKAAAQLYLDTVLNDDWPDVPEIAEGVKGVAAALARVPKGEQHRELRRSVVRSAVFPLCLAGCMAGRNAGGAAAREAIRDALLCEGGGAGNCKEAVQVMERVWALREARVRASGVGSEVGAGNEHVSWRVVLKETGVLLA